MSQTILITGASSGIGKAAAKYFANKGWNVIASMRSPEKETELANINNIMLVKLDVENQSSIEQAIEAGIQKFGTINALVNNAGYGQNGIFEAITEEQIQQQFNVNVFGVMRVIRTILPHFRKQKAGTIVNISSGAGRFTLPFMTPYCASKFALEGFSESLSFELGSQNIKVKIVEPGGTTTNFNDRAIDGFISEPSFPDYADYVGKFTKMLGAMANAKLCTAEEVAEVIFQSVTDGTDTLRYIIGNESFMKRINSRITKPDQEYIEEMKSIFS